MTWRVTFVRVAGEQSQVYETGYATIEAAQSDATLVLSQGFWYDAAGVLRQPVADVTVEAEGA